MRYDYGNHDEEFVFAYKSRPFAVLVSASLPTPTSSYIDHHLVMELGLKMTEVQCKKFSFGGKKLRMLGKISCTVQCVNNGQFFGNFHLRASVIENLTQHFDTHVVAGVQTVALLRGDRAASSSTGAPSPGRESPPPPRGPPSPRRSPPPASRPATPTRPSSPPGFPSRPQYPPPDPSQKIAPSFLINFNAISSFQDAQAFNLKVFTNNFGEADLELGPNSEIAALDDIHEEGDVENEENRVKVFTTIEGWVYRTGHGRKKCSWTQCVENVRCGTIPNNCAFHPQWYLPPGFQYCGRECRGAFCPCLQSPGGPNGYYG